MSRLLTWLNTDAMRGTAAYYMQFICLGLGAGIIGPTLPSLAEQTQTRVGQMGALFLAGAIGGTLGLWRADVCSIGCEAIGCWVWRKGGRLCVCC